MIFLAKLGIGVMGTALVAGAALCSEGFIDVSVQEKDPEGTHIKLIVPAALVPAALHFVPGDKLGNGCEQLRSNLPIIDAAIPALEDSPDGLLVEVMDPEDHVRISKRGSAIIVDVNDSEDVVHVSVPLRAAKSAIHQIAAANSPN